jgi:multimeric flavodoxin WrbA
MTPLYEKLVAARVVIAATPIFFYGPSAQLKAVVDRCQALWARKYMLKQDPPDRRGRGYLISAGATGGKKLFDGLLLTVRYFFDVLNLDFAGQVLIRGVDEKGAVDRRPDALALAWAMGEEIGDYLVKPGP